MSLKRYTAIADNTITNAYQSDLTTRGTGSNIGAADSLEVFSIFGQATSSSYEKTRMLVKFPVLAADETGSITSIVTDRASGLIPASGSVNFFLRMFNVTTDQTLPRDFYLMSVPVSQSWQEGIGVDLDNYKDLTYGGTGSNWINSGAGTTWKVADEAGGLVTVEGGSYLSGTQLGAATARYDEFNYTSYFDNGTENLSVDITGLVEQWIKGTGDSGFSNYGVGLMLTGSQEQGSLRSYYTKRFSARSSEYFFKRPIIEARWDSTTKDQRGTFILSSSARSPSNNLNTLYLYNYERGQLADFYHPQGTVSGSIYLQVYTSASAGTQVTTTPNMIVSGGWVSTGIYSASFSVVSSSTVFYDRWFSGSTDTTPGESPTVVYYHTGSFKPHPYDSSGYYVIPDYVTNITNLKPQYNENSLARFRLYTRQRNWNPTIYTVASENIETSIVDDAYFKVYRVVDNYPVIPYGTGSLNHTRLSYDVSGSYFDLDMKMLEPGYSYGIKFVYNLNDSYQEQPENFQFRIEKFNPNV
tara:strand:+ start:2373 stop:3953 length:1581 start_codon:yes stop_codon:yes gene_type:complete